MICFVALLVLLLPAGSLGGRTGDPPGREMVRTVSTAQLQDVVREYLEGKTRGLQEEVEIVIRSLPDRVTWKGETLGLQVEDNPTMRLRGPVTLVVNVLADGQVQNRIVVSAVIRTFAQVLVAARRLPRHAVLAPDDVRPLRMETTFVQRPLMLSADSLSGFRTRRIVSAGSILYEDLLEPQPLVFEGDNVSVFVSSGAVRLSTQAVAEEDGWRGDVISVRRTGNRDPLKARVEGTGSVAIVGTGKERP